MVALPFAMTPLKIFNSKGDKFYSWFEAAAQNNYLAAKELHNLLTNYKEPKKIAEKIHKMEHHGDSICHEIYDEINTSFITPVDREDIIELTRNLDDVMDLIHAAADSLEIYAIKKSSNLMIKFSEIIVESSKIIKDSLPYFRKRKNFSKIAKAIIEINNLENEADDLIKKGLKDLFTGKKNAIEIIKLKNIYETLENVVDKCEDIADLLRGLITKYA
jgi:uncharacterized protein